MQKLLSAESLEKKHCSIKPSYKIEKKYYLIKL